MTTLILAWTYEWGLDHFQHGLSVIFVDLFVEDYPSTLVALFTLLAAFFGSRYFSLGNFVRWVGFHSGIIAVFSTAVLAVGSQVLYRNHPLSMDEYAAYFQSRVFAAGKLHGTFPAPQLDWLVPRGFQDYFLNVSRATGSVAESYWPGFALLLTPFSWAGIPWLCNPVLSALTLLVIHRLALVLFADREAAGFSLLLTIASPVIFANGISFYSMPSHLLANSLFVLLLVHPTLLRATAAGVVGSLALVLHNPLPHLLFAAPWVAWLATRHSGIRLSAALIAGYLPLCALLGLGWFLFSGHLMNENVMPAGSPLSVLDRLLKMTEIFTHPNATVVLARLVGIAKIWVWAVPGLIILAAVGAIRMRESIICRLLAASGLLTVLGYFLVPVDQGHGWGYRYFHSAWMTLPLLATAALYPTQTAGQASVLKSLFENGETKGFVAVCILLTLTLGVGFRAWQLQAFVANDLRQIPQYGGAERRIVILNTRHSYYGADLVQNDPWLRENEIRMFSHGKIADGEMMANYYPKFSNVYEDQYGTVWSEASARAGSLLDAQQVPGGRCRAAC